MNKEPKEPMSQMQLMQRRRLLAQLVATGQRCRIVAEKFGVSDVTARNACKEFGVDIKFRRRGKSMGIYA